MRSAEPMLSFHDALKLGWSAYEGTSIKELRLAIADAETVLPSLGEEEQKHLRAAILHWRARTYAIEGDDGNALGYYRAALGLILELNDIRWLSRVYLTIGWMEYSTGDLQHAMESVHKGLDNATTCDDIVSTCRAHRQLGVLHKALGNHVKALEEYRKALHIAETQAPSQLGIIHTNIGNILSQLGYENAIESYNTALEIKQREKDETGLANLYGNIGSHYLKFGNVSTAEEWLRKGIAAAEAHGMKRELAYYTQDLAELLTDAGRYDEARIIIEQRESSAESHAEPRIDFLITRSKLAMHDGDSVRALSLLSEAHDQATAIPLPHRVKRVLEQQRSVYAQMKDWEKFALVVLEQEKVSGEINIDEQKRRISTAETEHNLTEERRQSEAQRQLLYNTLPDKIADRLLSGAKIVADTFDNVSVLFLDVVEFTSISAKIPPGHLIHILNSVFGMCDDVAEKHGLTKVKTIGDSYMAVCGVPEPLSDHAQRTASAAVELLSSLNTLRISMPEELGDKSWISDIPRLHIRIGLHCGPVVAGVVGTKRLQFDIWGDTVNVASRMETSGQSERIQVSDAFAKELTNNAQPVLVEADVVMKNDVFLCRLRGTMEIKGKGEMKTFWLESISR